MSIADLNEDEDGKLCGKGLRLGARDSLEMYGDCCAHEAHVLRIRLMRAEGLLRGVAMLSVMGSDYRDERLAEIDTFLKESP